MHMAGKIFNADFECPGCSETFNLTSVQKLQHMAVCKKEVVEETKEEEAPQPTSSNQKTYKCSVCLKTLVLTNVEILKHKKSCKIKEEKP